MSLSQIALQVVQLSATIQQQNTTITAMHGQMQQQEALIVQLQARVVAAEAEMAGTGVSGRRAARPHDDEEDDLAPKKLFRSTDLEQGS